MNAAPPPAPPAVAATTALFVAHARRTTWVVAARMLVELATGAALALWRRPPYVSVVAAWVVGVVWGSTWVWQVPRHDELARGFDARAHGRLVRSNWARTAAWTARGVLVAGVAARGLGWAGRA